VLAVCEGDGALLLPNLVQRELLFSLIARGVCFRFRAMGNSMRPFIRNGDVLTVSPPSDKPIQLGEVVAVTVPHTGRLVLHRVVVQCGEGWLVRGDNCPRADGVVPCENIIGRVTCVERQGRPVRLGLGPERVWIAALNRGGGLIRLKTLWSLARRIGAFALGRTIAMPE